VAKARVAYFDRWVHPIAGEMLADSAVIDPVRIEISGRPEVIAATLAKSYGMQALIRTDARISGTGERWLASEPLIEACPDLLAVCSAGAGHDVIDVEACTKRGIIVCNQSGAGSEAVAEHALGFMLALSKKITLADRAIRRSAAWARDDFCGSELFGKTLGIIGFGRIGGRLAELCAPFQMTILACDPILTAEQCASRGARKVELDELLDRSEFVSLSGPLSADTEGMFGAAQFAAMKPGAFFITTARGGMHDEHELTAALASGHLGGAGIDVFTHEPPPPDHPLFSFENVVVTPHSAGVTVEATRRIAIATVQQWETIFRGGVPPRLVNLDAWPRYAKRFEERLGFAPEPARETVLPE